MTNVLLVDNFDSFTWNLVDYLQQAGALVTLVRNNELKDVDTFHYQGIVISPGPGTPASSGELMWFLQNQIYQKPILGVCLGHQAIGVLFGAKLEKGKPMHGKVSVVTTMGNQELFHQMPEQFKVTRYHSLLLKNTAEPLEVVQQTLEGECMAIKHKTLPVWGIQYHPEAYLTEFGLKLVSNWVCRCM
jgi:anthranilate synthase component 2